MVQLFCADSADKLSYFVEGTFDSLVTDPPAGIGFMGKDWDSDKGGREAWIKWIMPIFRQCHRVLKPGAHGLVWAIPRTSHWTATALEDAGFEVRDVVTHLFGSGFPKSLNISLAIDKANGSPNRGKATHSVTGSLQPREDIDRSHEGVAYAPATDAAKQWSGWGTALKPASEHWILVRKPLSEKTVAKNVLKWGVGGINIDGCRIEGAPRATHGKNGNKITNSQGMFTMGDAGYIPPSPTGRFPANLVLDEAAAEALDAQSGVRKSGAMTNVKSTSLGYHGAGAGAEWNHGASEGGASRFFYVAKASKGEKNAGLEGMEKREAPGSKRSTPAPGRKSALGEARENFHPTVKPLKLMEYLIRLVTPPGGRVLDPFAGSGTTGVAAKTLGMKFTGIEKDQSYFEIATKRIE